MAIPSDLTPHSCEDIRTVGETIFPRLGAPLSPRSRVLLYRLTHISEPLTHDETQHLHRELLRGRDFLKRLTSFPSSWDPKKTEEIIERSISYFNRPLRNGEGLRPDCLGLGLLPRIEPSLLQAHLSNENMQKILKQFGLNAQGQPIATYFGGDIIAGSWRPSAKRLLIVYADTHLSPQTQREILQGFWHLQQDGLNTLALEGVLYSPDHQLRDPALLHHLKAMTPEKLQLARQSLQSLLQVFNQEATRLKAQIENGPPRVSTRLFYPAQARSLIITALMQPKGRVLGLNDPHLPGDVNLLCGSHSLNRPGQHPLERRALYEACMTYPVQLQTHLALRRLKRALTQKDRVILATYGLMHIFSVVGELQRKEYNDLSFIVVVPPAIFEPITREMIWWERQGRRAVPTPSPFGH